MTAVMTTDVIVIPTVIGIGNVRGTATAIADSGMRLHVVRPQRNVGLLLIWLAAALTLVTGLDYLRKALPHLKGA